ncbi:hypothetical protein D4Q85_00625 [bacterium]|nr:MAG: hypothetical protein D4Q85_00625 [bacterium]
MNVKGVVVAARAVNREDGEQITEITIQFDRDIPRENDAVYSLLREFGVQAQVSVSIRRGW